MKFKKLLVLLMLLGSAFALSACNEPGAQGEKGETGAPGLAGETGEQGDKGATGEVGDKGPAGDTGADGVEIEFSYTSEGIAWRYAGETEWNVSVKYADIFKVIAESEVGDKVAAQGFDYYVSPELADYPAAATFTAFDHDLTVGTNAFATLADAIAAANAASAVEGYTGLKIFVNKGVYREYAELTASNVMIYGPNVNVNPNTETRITPAIFEGSIIVSGAKFTINGVDFGGANDTASNLETDYPAAAAQLTALQAGGANSELHQSNLLVKADDLKVLYCSTTEDCKKQYMITWAAATKGIELGYNLIYPKRTGGDVRPVRSYYTTENSFIHHNTFRNNEPKGNYDDAVRFQYLAGYCIITDNEFNFTTDNWCLFLGLSSNKCSQITIEGNHLYADNGKNDGGTIAGIAIRNLAEASEYDCQVSVRYNVVDNGSGNMIQMRLSGSGDAAIKKGTLMHAYIENNIFEQGGNWSDCTAVAKEYVWADKYTAATVADETAFAAGEFYVENEGAYTLATTYDAEATYYTKGQEKVESESTIGTGYVTNKGNYYASDTPTNSVACETPYTAKENVPAKAKELVLIKAFTKNTYKYGEATDGFYVCDTSLTSMGFLWGKKWCAVENEKGQLVVEGYYAEGETRPDNWKLTFVKYDYIADKYFDIDFLAVGQIVEIVGNELFVYNVK